MAIFKSVIFNKLNKSLGNVTMYELDGQNVLRGKYSKHDCQSPAQLAQRAKMKAVRMLSHKVLKILVIGIPGNNLGSRINAFISRNIGVMNPDEEYQVTYDVRQIQLSTGELLPPKVTAVIDRKAGTVTFTQERQPLHPFSPDDDRVYGVVWGKDSCKTQVFPLGLRCEPGETVAELEADILTYPLEVYAFTVSANGKKTSKTIWLGEDV